MKKFDKKSDKKHPKKPAHKKRPSSRGQTAPSIKGRANLWGVHAVTEAWHNPARDVRALYATAEALERFTLSAPCKRPPPHVVDKRALDKLLPPGAVHQGLALDCAPLEESTLQDFIIAARQADKSVLLMLDQVTDPHNVGAIMRSASAFGAAGCVMQRRHAPELEGVLAKTACGAVEHLPVSYETNLTRALEELQDAGFFAVGLDERGARTIGEMSFAGLPDKIVLVLGAEGPGLRRLVREKCDELVRLPTQGAILSLNVSNAAAVALYALLGT